MDWTQTDDTTWEATDRTGDYTITARSKVMFDLTFVSNVPVSAKDGSLADDKSPMLSRAQRLGPYTSREYAMQKAEDIRSEVVIHFLTIKDVIDFAEGKK